MEDSKEKEIKKNIEQKSKTFNYNFSSACFGISYNRFYCL